MTEDCRTTAGGRIDRARPVRFRFDGVAMTGLEGDTLASALLANGVHLMGRSFKYHRPRGVLAAGPEEPNALMRVARGAGPATPNLRAPTVELFDGLVAESQNRAPSLRFDVGVVADWLAPLLPAGFYYKTFMGPGAAWRTLWEPLIRRAAGLGRAPHGPDPDRYAHRWAHADVLVIGAGAAGLAAARSAAATGARVILCDEQAEPGGWLLSAPADRVEGRPAWDWVQAQAATLDAAPRVTVLPRTTAFGHFPHNMVGLVQRLTDHLPAPPPGAARERLWMVRARHVVFATGAIERPLVFAGNDRPGIMLAGAARSFAERWGVRVGRRAVVVTAHDDAYDAAIAMLGAGIEVAGIAELRPSPGAAADRARRAGIAVWPGMRVAGTTGRRRVSGIALLAPDGRTRRLRCDVVAVSGGFTPSVHLHAQARGRLAWDDALGAPVPDGAIERVSSVGACRGAFGLDAAVRDGDAAGAAAAQATDWTPAPRGPSGGGLAGIADGMPGGRRFVDFQNDVTDKDLALALREGFRSIEHVKRYTTTGMATDQGKTSNLNALAIVAAGRGLTAPDVGLTTYRMPYTPTSFGAFAGPGRGALFDPVRTPPTHDQAAAMGAVFEDVGAWKRARAFPRGTETLDQAVARECLAVRRRVGLFDASTLGKIEVCGPDAATFLERIYVNAWRTLAPGRCRYGIMLRESGFVMDDGVVGRLAPDRFHVTTTTGGAAAVLAQMEDYLQTEWPELEAWLTPTTEHWAALAVQGPAARAVVAAVTAGIDLDALPHMGVAPARIRGVDGRLFRVSFTGELGYELNVPARHGPALWSALLEAGAPHGITPYGTEAMHVLRAEKGYVIVGQESDGTATPDDLGLGWAVGKAKPDFVGRRSMLRPAMRGAGRKQLVGLHTPDGTLLPEGAQVVGPSDRRRGIGHVTSSYRSAALGRPIALAMIEDGRVRIGAALESPLFGGFVPVQVVPPVFYDPKGERLHG